MGGSSSSPQSQPAESGDDGSTVVSVSEAVAKRLLGKEGPANTSTDAVRVSEEKIKSATSAFKLPSAKEDKLKMLEAYQKRIEVLENYNTGLQEFSKEQFSQAVEEVESKFMKHQATGPVCVELQEAVARCYVAYPTATLNCAPEVQAFKECVEKHRKFQLLQIL